MVHGSSGQFAGGTGHGELSFVPMAKTPTKIEVMQEGDERFLLMTLADGSEERKPRQAAEEAAAVSVPKGHLRQEQEEGILRKVQGRRHDALLGVVSDVTPELYGSDRP